MEAQQRTAAELYLDLLKKCLTRYLFGEDYVPVVPPKGTLKHTAFEPVRRWLAGKDMEVIRHVPFNEQVRAEGRDWRPGPRAWLGCDAWTTSSSASPTCSAAACPGT